MSLKYISFLFLILCFSSCNQKTNNLKKHTYYSQYNQDQWVNENIFKDKRDGVFIDIGAHDGKSINNTYFFEKELGWKGICIEPMPDIFERLKKNRNCICICAGVAEIEEAQDFLRIHGYSEMLSGFIDKYDPDHMKRIQRELKKHGGFSEALKIQTRNINNILSQYDITHVDFLSLDTEGGEFDILKSIDFSRFSIHVIAVENNYSDKRIRNFLKNKGYYKATNLGCDEIYVFDSRFISKVKMLFKNFLNNI